MTNSQVAQPGFRVVEGVLSGGECQALLEVLSSDEVRRSRAGARHLMAVPQIAGLARDPRLIEIARWELGAAPFPFRVTLFEKSAKANWLVVWHQDTALPLRDRFAAAGWGPWSNKAGLTYAHAPAWALARMVALRVHLDSSTINNGPLRVVPDSHHLGVLTDEEIAAAVKDYGFIECLVARGGVLAMRPLLIHSSSKIQARAVRRVLHIEYADSLSFGPEIELAIA